MSPRGRTMLYFKYGISFLFSGATYFILKSTNHAFTLPTRNIIHIHDCNFLVRWHYVNGHYVDSHYADRHQCRVLMKRAFNVE
jgi:hypothetical protein